MTDSIQYVTAEGLKKLEAELNDLLTVQRPNTAERIQKAKEFGDLAENAEYAEAKDQQAFIEGRILELKNIIKSAVLIKSKKSDGTVRVGSRIKVKLPDKKTKEYEIVGSQEADPSKGRISNESPMGEAFLGKKAGDSVTYTAPRGTMNCTILEVL